jgi:Domain of unknown function (DUF4091)
LKFSSIRTACLPVAVAACSIFSGVAAARSEPVVWTASTLHRVGMSESPSGGAQVSVAAARNGYASFQIVVNGASGLSNVNVSVSDLKGPGGAVIPHSSFALYREKYVNVTASSPNWGGSNKPHGPGWYADGLIPFTDPETGKPLSGAQIQAVPFDVKSGANQPIWVDLLVPQNAKNGDYTGTYTVTSNEGNVTGTIALTVWNFSLPTTPSLKTSFLFSHAGTLEAQKELLRNKISPSATPAVNMPLLSGRGLNATDTGPFSGADIGNCRMSPAPDVNEFKRRTNGQQPGVLLYDYSADEIGHCTNLYPTIRQWAFNMHQAGINNLVSISPTPALFSDGSNTGRSAVDIWVLLPVMYNNSKSAVEQVLKKGDSVWSYNTLVQDAYSPKWEIDFDPVDFRIEPGFISQSLNLTGLLYWRIDRWPSDPWNNVNNTGSFSSANYPGEGMLVYPGQQVGVPGVVASMRLKWIRDGIEDYEYAQILKSLGKADLALQISRSVGPDWTNWSRDAKAIDNARLQIGRAIDETMSKTHTDENATAATPASQTPDAQQPASGR